MGSVSPCLAYASLGKRANRAAAVAVAYGIAPGVGTIGMRPAKILPDGDAVQRFLRAGSKAAAAVFMTKLLRLRIALQRYIGEKGADVQPVAKQSVHDQRIFPHAADTGQHCRMAHGQNALSVKALRLPMLVGAIAGDWYAGNALCLQLTAGIEGDTVDF